MRPRTSNTTAQITSRGSINCGSPVNTRDVITPKMRRLVNTSMPITTIGTPASAVSHIRTPDRRTLICSIIRLPDRRDEVAPRMVCLVRRYADLPVRRCDRQW